MLRAAGVEVRSLKKLAEHQSPNVLDMMHNHEIGLLINTTSGPVSRRDEVRIRSEAILLGVPIVTTEAGARATVAAIAHVGKQGWGVTALQDYLSRP